MAQSLLQATSPTATALIVAFSGPVNGATTAGNWTLSTGSVSSVSAYGTDQKAFRLVVSGLTAGSSYTVTAGAGITDTSSGALANNAITFSAGRAFGDSVALTGLSGKRGNRTRKGSSGSGPVVVPNRGNVGWPVG